MSLPSASASASLSSSSSSSFSSRAVRGLPASHASSSLFVDSRSLLTHFDLSRPQVTSYTLQHPLSTLSSDSCLLPPPPSLSSSSSFPHLPTISLNSPVLSPPPASMSDTQSTLEGPCAVCGTATKHRSSCAEHGFDLFLCGREHQKLVSFSSFLSFMRTRTSSPRSSADLVRS